MGQSLLPGVPVAAAVVKAAVEWLAIDCPLDFPLRACQPAVWGQAGGCHGVLATAVDLQLGLVSHWRVCALSAAHSNILRINAGLAVAMSFGSQEPPGNIGFP